jgi:uncharacterized BrkB/YihY/UPF0761 family membrane protein
VQSIIALVTAIATGEATDAMARARRTAIVYLIAGLLGLCGLMFLLVAAFIATAQKIGPLDAALWFGGGFLAVSIVIFITYRIMSAIRARRVAERRKNEVKSVVSAAAIALLPTLLASRGGSIALLGPALGLLGFAVYRENSRSRGRRGMSMSEDDRKPRI